VKYLLIEVSKDPSRRVKDPAYRTCFAVYMCTDSQTWNHKLLKLAPGKPCKMSITRNNARYIVLPDLPCKEWGFLKFEASPTHLHIRIMPKLDDSRTMLFDEINNECWLGYAYKIQPFKIPLTPRVL
jgi:hypothetical protein